MSGPGCWSQYALAALVLTIVHCGPVVGPGSLTSYGGPPRQSMFGGIGIVQDPALGFFVAGSSIDEMNGVYLRTHQVSAALHRHTFLLAYSNDISSWLLGLVQAKDTPEGNQWLLVDDHHRDRFASRGGQILPGSGTKWRQAQGSGDSQEQRHAVATSDRGEEDEDEFPWQIVGIMGQQMLDNLRELNRRHHHATMQRLRDAGLSAPEMGTVEASWQEGKRIFRVVDPAGVSVFVRPMINSSFVGLLREGDYLCGSAGKQEGWMRLCGRTPWGRQPCWIRVFARGSLASVEIFPEEDSAGIHESPAEESIDRLMDRGWEPEDDEAPKLLEQTMESEKSLAIAMSSDDNTLKESPKAPHEFVLDGAHGSRASSAAHDAFEGASAMHGIAQLRALLAKELLRPQNLSRSYGEAPEESPSALRLRLTIVRALLAARRDASALAEVEAATRANPAAAAALLWVGRIRLRRGHRKEGLDALKMAVEGHKGVDGEWGQIGATVRLRAATELEHCMRQARAAYAADDYRVAARHYDQAVSLGKEPEAREDKWGRAIAQAERGLTLRRLRDMNGALESFDAALLLFPRYKRALFRRGVVLLELGRPQDGIKAFERILGLDRKWPKLCEWLIRAHAHLHRKAKSNGASPGYAEDEVAEDYHLLLEVSMDFTLEELKQAFRKASLKYHPDKPGGSDRAFQRAAAAYETLADPEKRKAYFEGRVLKDLEREASVTQEVERKYFPERQKFWPFGDPFEEKRRVRAWRSHRSSSH